MKHYTRKTIAALTTALLLVPSASALTYSFPGTDPPEQYHPQSGAEAISEGYQIPAANKATALPMALPSADAGMMYNLIGVSAARARFPGRSRTATAAARTLPVRPRPPPSRRAG